MKADAIIKQARDRLNEINRELTTLVEEKAKLERIVGGGGRSGHDYSCGGSELDPATCHARDQLATACAYAVRAMGTRDESV